MIVYLKKKFRKKEYNTVVDREHIAASANRKNKNLKNGSKDNDYIKIRAKEKRENVNQSLIHQNILNIF